MIIKEMNICLLKNIFPGITGYFEYLKFQIKNIINKTPPRTKQMITETLPQSFDVWPSESQSSKRTQDDINKKLSSTSTVFNFSLMVVVGIFGL